MRIAAMALVLTAGGLLGMQSPTLDPNVDRNPTCGYTVSEDSTGRYPCGFDCATMGNGLCGPYGVTPHSIRRA